ncbi:mycofactocin biosynthesis chaperone MftB [Nocardia sp. NPDC004860]|uniref:mycofactocin biosynthesis chaperone MftB n=1 Tax=Nocardia sp. NPDC004860 TaxID=3154557 RepID=UPI0033AF357C
MCTDDQSFDPHRAYMLSESVSLRPEPFGALVYDFSTRKLSFLKTLALVSVVRELAGCPDAQSAVAAAGVAPIEYDHYLGALARLHDAGTIRSRPAIDTPPREER